MTWLATLAWLILQAPTPPAPEAPQPEPPTAEAPAPAPAEFKLVITLFGAGAEPRGTSELVFARGRAYQFVADTPEEVIVIDPAAGMVELLDLRRRLHTELSFDRLDKAADALREAIRETIRKREEEGTRAARVAAAMSRDLIEPGLEVTADESGRKLRMINKTVEVDATGAADLDAPRLAAAGRALDVLAKLSALRMPAAIPPFSRMEALDALIVARKLRPEEVSLLYRLAGPPTRYRWTFELVDGLSDREREAIDRVDGMRSRARSVRYEAYERAAGP